MVAVLLIGFCIRYRRRPGETGTPPETTSSHALEWFWTLTPLAIFVSMFVWGAKVYLDAYRGPDDAPVGLRRGQAVDVEVPASRKDSGRSTPCTCPSGGRPSSS